MKLTSLFIFLIPLAFADPTTVLSDLQKVQTDVTSLNTTLNSFPDNSTQIPGNTLIKLQDENAAIANALKKLVKDVKASTPFTGSTAHKIIIAILKLQPATFSLLDNLVAHKTALANSGVSSIVIRDLKTDQKIVAALGPALEAKVPKKYKPDASPIEQSFYNRIQDAINALSGKSA